MSMNSNLSRRLALFLALALLLGSMACSKDDDDVPQPSTNWRLTYEVQGLSDIEITSITYIDAFGMPQTVAGDRNFRLTQDVESGFFASMTVEALATNGGVTAKIFAQALDGSLRNAFASDDDGHSGTEPEPIEVTVQLTLP